MGWLKKISKKVSKQVKKAIRSPSHSKLASVVTLGAIGKHNGRWARKFGISRNHILKSLGLKAGNAQMSYNSAGSLTYTPRRISTLMGGV